MAWAPDGMAAELLEITRDEGGFIVSFERSATLNAVLRFRQTEMLVALSRVLQQIGPTRAIPTRSALRVTWMGQRTRDLRRTFVAATLTAREIANRPCTAPMVAELLGVSPRDCLRWTKDGRLRVTGAASLRAGPDPAGAHYPAEEIARLAASASIIAEWRATDAATALFKHIERGTIALATHA
jgi:hypothetical protein